MRRAALFLSLLLVLLKFTQGQASLGIDSISVVPNIVNFNQFVTITINVVNTGNAPFNGAVHFEYTVNDSLQEVLDTLNTIFQIDTGGSAQAIISNYQITPLKYAIGDNIVVIWPVAVDSTVATTDSEITHIFVDTSLSVGPPVLRQQIKVFYIGGNHSVFINYGGMISHIRDVTCYSILGEETTKYNYAVNEISFAKNSPKMFLLVIRTTEGEFICFKILGI